jgi:hypothetical protein
VQELKDLVGRLNTVAGLLEAAPIVGMLGAGGIAALALSDRLWPLAAPFFTLHGELDATNDSYGRSTRRDTARAALTSEHGPAARLDPATPFLASAWDALNALYAFLVLLFADGVTTDLASFVRGAVSAHRVQTRAHIDRHADKPWGHTGGAVCGGDTRQ